MSDADFDEKKWIEDFLFGAPLYVAKELPDGLGYRMLTGMLSVDGHCPYCHSGAIFQRKGDLDISKLHGVLQRAAVYILELICTRDRVHKLTFILRFVNENVQKIGQYPSLADIANDESRSYRKVLTPDDASDLHRAIGLAAHGVGVGSFVYLRRVFENWNDDELVRLRMDERIELLRNHLPDFLVKNKRLHSILSLGIHELSEKECLDAFELLKHSTFFMLDDDRRKKEELEGRQRAEKAIAAFSDAKNTNSKSKA
jgi:hypothetical protein